MNDICYDITLKDGTYKEYYWRVVNVPVFDDEGSVEFIINSATNITEQRLNEHKYELMLNNAEDSFVLIDRERKILNFNEAYAEKTRDIFGKDPEVGISIMEFALPERVDKVNDILEKVFNGEIVKADLEMTNTDGRNRYFYTTYRPAILENGAIYGALFSVYEKTKEFDTKKELEISEARYRALVENGNDVLFILSPEAKPTYISPSIKNVLGYSQEEAYEMDLMKLVHPDDISIVASELEKCMDKPGEPLEVTPARMKHKDGRYRWFEATITNMLHDPAINGIVDNFRDITDRIEYQEAIAEAKEKYQSLIQTIDGVVWEAEPDSLQTSYMSPQSLPILGHDADVWASTVGFWEDHIHPDDQKKTCDKFIKLTQAGKNHELEYRFKKENGEYIWVRDVITVITEDGIPEVIRGVIIDINKEKELQIELDQVYKIASIGNWEVDMVNDQLYWSEVVKKTFEVDPDFKPELNTAIEFYTKNENRDAVEKVVEKALEVGKSYDIELQITTAKGNRKWIRNIGKPDFRDGKCVRIYGTTQDITERKEAELELKRSNEALVERIKEQRCLYDITNLNEGDLTIPKLLEKAANIIPRAMLFEEFAQARITWHNQHMRT
ncbi:PAS domain-containing protein [Gracilimonas halophila]|uniref:histidine kinase n=1 Tax=Gracilimonas halophila TaxID=1834464 RepID=A0ABW5JIH7_9BACT